MPYGARVGAEVEFGADLGVKVKIMGYSLVMVYVYCLWLHVCYMVYGIDHGLRLWFMAMCFWL